MLVGIYQRCIKYPIFFVECGRRISKLTEQYRKQFCAVRLVMSVVLRGFNDAILPAQAAPKRGGGGNALELILSCLYQLLE